MIGGAATLLAARAWTADVVARRGTSGPGDPCRHDDQCVAADTALVCAWNGFGYDGDLNCCAYNGSRCGDDSGCCGYSVCSGGFCSGDGGTSSAGNGGVAIADARGGTVSIGDIYSGGNVGNAIGVGNTSGGVSVNGGSISNVTDVSVDAQGGVAIADASGGSGNVSGTGGGGGYGRPGDACPAYCLPGPSNCPSCVSGWCTRSGYCG